MQPKYVYFIENEKGEWYRFNPGATLKPHRSSSDRRVRCDCDDCTGNGKDFYSWTTNPIEAAAFQKEAVEQLKINIGKDKLLKNCKITEHEFVPAR